ncbi:unnamed protein product [Thelazia callipaeda]|uniref:non-specific serine/threonine protein kinase n=1 Tax=Thelazia callipaeda TaxID=103827 RepID=A0A0N5CX22_THECL|nr:unnamed protein product [Thelazia callipaeda]
MNNQNAENPNAQPDLLNAGDVVADRFIVEEKIGQGSFGQIYRGNDKFSKRTVAVKVEPEQKGVLSGSPNDPRRLVIEQQVLLALREKKNIPEIYASGKTCGNCPYIVMQILGKNLTTLRKERKVPKFTASTAFRTGEQIAHALQYLHESRYIHRDIKPSNCCIGVPPFSGVIYLVDFGLCRKVSDAQGMWHVSLPKSIFKGTLRYASLNSIKTRRCGPSDDLIGWTYSIIELALSKLPWARSTPREMIRQKASITSEELCAQMPAPFLQAYKYALSLRPTQMPKHAFFNECLKQCIPLGVKPNDPYDWDICTYNV